MKGVRTKKANRRILKKKEGLLKRAFFSPKRNSWTGFIAYPKFKMPNPPSSPLNLRGERGGLHLKG
jgi:hypothetical protein